MLLKVGFFHIHQQFGCIGVGSTIRRSFAREDVSFLDSNKPSIEETKEVVIVLEVSIHHRDNSDMRRLSTHFQELVEGVHITLSILDHLQDVESSVCSILGMTNNKEDEVDSVEVSHLNKVGHQPQHIMILVLSRTVVEDDIQFLPHASSLLDDVKVSKTFHEEGCHIIVATLLAVTFLVDMTVEMLTVRMRDINTTKIKHIQRREVVGITRLRLAKPRKLHILPIVDNESERPL
jgi:hypothetical protein